MYTANPVSLIPFAHIFTGKICSHYRRDPVYIITVNLFSKQVVPCTPPVLPYTRFQCKQCTTLVEVWLVGRRLMGSTDQATGRPAMSA